MQPSIKTFRLLACCMLMLTVFACGKKDPKLVILEGELIGLGNDTLHLYGDDKLYPNIDTIPATEGKFKARLHADTLVSVRLLLPDGTEHPLYLKPGDHIQLKGSVDETQDITVYGNPDNDALTEFLQSMAGPGTYSVQARQERAETFIKEHPNSLASLYVLEKYFVLSPEPDYERIRKLIGYLSSEMRDRPYTTGLSAQLKELGETGEGRMITLFSLPGADGKLITRGTFRSKYLLVHFWASWDSLSTAGLGMYRRIYKKEKKNDDFAMLGISLDIDSLKWRERMERDTLEWYQGCDLKGWHSEPVENMAIQRLPANLLLNPYGRVEGRDLSEQAIADKLEKAREEKERREKNATRLKNRQTTIRKKTSSH